METLQMYYSELLSQKKSKTNGHVKLNQNLRFLVPAEQKLFQKFESSRLTRISISTSLKNASHGVAWYYTSIAVHHDKQSLDDLLTFDF